MNLSTAGGVRARSARRLKRFAEGLLDRLIGTYVQERIAEHLLSRHLVYGDPSRLSIDSTAVVNNALFNTASGSIRVERHAFFGHHVCLLTGTHDYTKLGPERQTAVPQIGRDIRIGEGAWLGTSVIILGPCTIGEHAVVAAGSIVSHDVPPYHIVAGVPARTVKRISPDGVAAGPDEGVFSA